MADKSKDENVTPKPTAAAARRPLTASKTPSTAAKSTLPGTASRTTPTSAARTTTNSSLSKPPVRSTGPNTVRKPASTATPPTSTSTHRSRPSIASVNDDKPDGKKDGISARPKRMSIVPSANTERVAASTARSALGTPASRTSVRPSTTTRPSVTSPTEIRRTAATSSGAAARTTRPISSTLASRTGVVQEKKRLSTIPASPAITKVLDDDKENVSADGQKTPVRPPLGSRRSTRSVMMEQRIREYELVTNMLQAAMADDGSNSVDQDEIEKKMKERTAKLRSDLAKVRQFEREHGRAPTEDELADVDSSPDEDKELLGLPSSEQIEETTTELVSSKERQEALSARVAELESSAEASTAEFESRIQAFKDEMQQRELEAGSASQVQQALDKSHLQVESLQTQIGELTAQLESATKEATKHQDESVELKSKFDAHNAEKEHGLTEARNLSDSLRAEVQELSTKLETLMSEGSRYKAALEESKSANQSLNTELDEWKLKLSIASKEKDAELQQTREASSSLQKQVEELTEKLSAASTEHETSTIAHQQRIETLNAQISQLKSQVTSSSKSSEDELTVALQALETARLDHEEELVRKQADLAAVRTRLAESEVRNQAIEEAASKTATELQQKLIDTLSKSDSEFAITTAKIESLTSQVEGLNAELVQRDETVGREHAKAMETVEAAQREQVLALSQSRAEVEALQKQLTEVRLKTTELQKNAEEAEKKASEAREAVAEEHAAKLTSLSTQHQQALEAAHAAHASKLSEASAAHQRELDAVRSNSSKHEALSFDHKKQLETLREEHAKSIQSISENHEKAIAAAREDAQKSLQDQMSVHDEIQAGLSSSHAKELEDLKHQHSQELTNVRASTADFAAEINKLKATLDDTQGTHSEQLKEISKLSDQQLADLSAEHRHAIDALKNSHSLEINGMRNEHSASLEQVKKLKSELVATHEDHSALLEGVAKTHEAKLAHLRAEHEAAVSALRESHAFELQNARKEGNDFAASSSAELATAKADLIAKTAEAEHVQTEIAQLKEARSKDVASLQSQLQTLQEDHGAALASHESAKQSALSELEARLNEIHASTVKSINRDHASRVAKLEADASSALGSLEELESQHAAALASAQDGSAEQIRSLEQQVRSAVANSDAAQFQVQSLKGILASLETEAKETEIEHEKELQKVEGELSLSVVKIAQMSARMADMEHGYAEQLTSSRLKDAEEWQGKLADVEGRLKKSEDARAKMASELEDKVGVLQRELDMARDYTSTAQSATLPAAAEGENSTAPSSSLKGGVGASKWASGEAEVSPQSPTSPAHLTEANQDRKIDPATDPTSPPRALATTLPTIADPGPRGKKSNVSGQLKGIEVQIKHLNEMSEEWLRDNERMAGLLSRVAGERGSSGEKSSGTETAKYGDEDDSDGERQGDEGDEDLVGEVGRGGEA